MDHAPRFITEEQNASIVATPTGEEIWLASHVPFSQSYWDIIVEDVIAMVG